MVPLKRVALLLLRRVYKSPWSFGSQAGCALASPQQRVPASVSSLSALHLHTASSQLSQLTSLQTASQPFPCVIHGHQRSIHTDQAKSKGPQMHETHTSEDAHKLIVIQPEYKTGPIEKPYVPSSYKLEEAVALVEAISGWEVKGQRVEAIRQVHSKYLIIFYLHPVCLVYLHSVCFVYLGPVYLCTSIQCVKCTWVQSV